jgi:hypothetical protein
MNKREFMTWFNEQVQSRRPIWQVNACILGDWFAASGRHQAVTLTRAVQRHKIDDDPSRPRLGKVHFVVREINTPYHRPALGYLEEVVSAKQFWEKVRTNFGRKKCVGLMKQQIKFDPHARDKDPEACGWRVHETSPNEPACPRPPP